MATLGSTCPYYGGTQVPNPANVILVKSAPSNKLKVALGTMAIINSTGTLYVAVSNVGSVTTWALTAGGSSEVNTLTGGSGGAISPTGGNITLAGTANQITTTGSGSTITWTLPAAITAPGSLTTTTTLASGTTVTAGTGVTATTGAITASAGQLIAGGDTGGVASTVAISNTSSSTISTGVGSVKMSTANAATNTEWLKIYIGTSAFWIPAWTTNAP